MPKRKVTARFDSAKVQGEDSWVELRRLTVGEIREIRKGNKPDSDAFEIGVDVAKDHVVGWNWADEDGGPLPLPSNDPAVMDGLTDRELQFISDALIGNEAEQKN